MLLPIVFWLLFSTEKWKSLSWSATLLLLRVSPPLLSSFCCDVSKCAFLCIVYLSCVHFASWLYGLLCRVNFGKFSAAVFSYVVSATASFSSSPELQLYLLDLFTVSHMFIHSLPYFLPFSRCFSLDNFFLTPLTGLSLFFFPLCCQTDPWTQSIKFLILVIFFSSSRIFVWLFSLPTFYCERFSKFENFTF